MKLFEENTGKHCKSLVGDDFLDKTPSSKQRQPKQNETKGIMLNSSAFAQQNEEKSNRMRKIFENHLSDIGLTCWICQQLKKNKNLTPKNNKPQEMGKGLQ